jgi:hypothetical protein
MYSPNKISLGPGTWSENNARVVSQWFTFIAPATPHIHIDFTMSADVYVTLYDAGGTWVDYKHFTSSGYTDFSPYSFTAGDEYALNVGVYNAEPGTYKIAVSDSATPP